MRNPGSFSRWNAALAAVVIVAGGSRATAQPAPTDAPAPAPLPAIPPPPVPAIPPPVPAPVLVPAPVPVLVPVPAPAPEIVTEAAQASPVEIHAFASQGFILTTGNDYIAPDTKHGSFQLSEVGINFTREVGDRLRFGVQAFAQNLGPGGNFNLKADWFYLDYRFRSWFGFRAGRLKIPFGFYNDVNDIDSARAPILLPQSVYPLQGRNFLFAQTGLELYGFARSRAAGALDYRLFLGTIFIDPAILVPAGSTVQLQLNVRYVGGGRIFWETPLDGLRVGGSLLVVHMDVAAFVGGMRYPITNQSRLAVGSVEYVVRNLILSAEYSRWHTDQESIIPTSNLHGTSERSYAMVTYRAASWFQPAAYYALHFPDVTMRDAGPASRQHDVALTLRFDVTSHWIVKIEGHYMEGTAGLGAPLSITPLPTNPAQHWGVFLLKTTGYF